ncbi:MAG: cytochrome P450 [Dehalococcoidia bacterium]
MTTQTNPFSSEMKKCPYPHYDEWRDESPLVWSDDVKAWLVTSYEVAKGILDDSKRFSSKNSVFGGPRIEHPEFPSMINRDEPDHRKLRSLVSKAFTPRTIEEAWEPRIREYITELLDAVDARTDGRMEVVGDLAYPLPVQIIAEIIGIPPSMHAQFKHWSNLIVQDIGRIPDHGYDSIEEVAEAVGQEAPRTDRSNEEMRAEMEEYARRVQAGEVEPSLFMYFYMQIHDRRAHPKDDLLTRLVEAEVDGDHLSDNELVAFLVLLLVAGNETTTNLIIHTLRALSEDLDLQRRVRADRALLIPMLEEALRWESPIQGFYRRALEDVEVAGTAVKAGDALLILYAAANHDPAKFECPEEFRVDRFAGQTGTRDHLAFGFGIHYCLGANLARLEAARAIEAVLDRWPEFTAATPEDDIEWWDTPFFRGPKAFEVSLSR